MKILVTGANGYLGQGIVKALLDKVAIGEKSVYHQVSNPNSAMRKFNVKSNLCGIRSLEVQKEHWKKSNKKIESAWEYHYRAIKCFSRYQRYSRYFASWTDETLGNWTGSFGSEEAAEYSVCCNQCR